MQLFKHLWSARLYSGMISLLALLISSGPAQNAATIAVISIVDKSPVHGVETVVGKVTKHPNNPLFRQDKPWEPRIDNGYPNVIYDPANDEGFGIWRCFYGDCVDTCDSQILLYANSSDGLNWHKPSLGLFDVGEVRTDLAHHGKENNIIMKGGGLGIYRDLHDSNVSRRYKCIGEGCGACLGGGGCPAGVRGTAVSADGFHWTDLTNITWPDPQRYDCHNQVLYVPDQKAYLATTRDGFFGNPGRTIGIAKSKGDTFEWSTQSAPVMVLKGDANNQLYSQVTFQWHNILLGIVMVYDANSELGQVHCRLAWSPSTDVLSGWQWVDKGGLTGEDFIPLGHVAPVTEEHINSSVRSMSHASPSTDFDALRHHRLPWTSMAEANDFDSHICFAAASPIRIGSEERIYYMGGNGPHNGARNSSFGLATLRADGFAGMQGTGSFETKNVVVTGTMLLITSDVLLGGGSVRIGFHASGLSLVDAVPETSNVTNKQATFKSGMDLSSLVGKSLPLQIRLDNAIIYTISFTSEVTATYV